MTQNVVTASEQRQRKIDLDEEEEKRAARRKNKDFTQIYKPGWRRVRQLAQGNPGATMLYSFFAEHIDSTCGAVIADQAFLAEKLDVTTRTIRRWLEYLEERKAIVRIPVAGKVCAYALDPHEVWKGYDDQKEYAAFVTRTLVNREGDIKRRLTAMFSEQESTEDEKLRDDLEKMGQQRIPEPETET